MKRWVATGILACALLSALLACGKGSPTLPTPVPSASPSPSEEVFPGPLHIEGERFLSRSGKSVILLGGIVCCGGPDGPENEYPGNGWPWASEDQISFHAENGANYMHFRLGPFTRKGERPEFVAYEDAGAGRVNLDVWNDSFWQALSQRVTYARSKGVYVELDLIDAWVLERPEISPWSKGNNINGVDAVGERCDIITRPINSLQERWLTKIIEVTRPFDNVIYQVSNESGGNNCGGVLQEEWELSIIDLMRRLHPGALVGTNSGRGGIEAVADYVTVHTYFAQPPRGKPVMVNEYGENLSPEDINREMRDGIRMGGSSFHYWRGNHSRDEFLRTLEYLRSIRAEIKSRN